MLLETGSRLFRMANTTTSNTAMPMVNRVPVKSAANGRIDNPMPPSVQKKKIRKYKKQAFLAVLCIGFQLEQALLDFGLVCVESSVCCFV